MEPPDIGGRGGGGVSNQNQIKFLELTRHQGHTISQIWNGVNSMINIPVPSSNTWQEERN